MHIDINEVQKKKKEYTYTVAEACRDTLCIYRNRSQMEIGWRKDKFVRLRSWVIMIWRNSVDHVHVRTNSTPVCVNISPRGERYLLFFLFPSAFLSFPSLYLRSSQICIYARTGISKRYIRLEEVEK